jgi:hypothetical protein
MSTPLPVAPTGEQMVAILSQAYEIGSLAMATTPGMIGR